jgi:SAM-dependent methyltransferase
LNKAPHYNHARGAELSQEHWPLMAQYWTQIGSPLRPAKEDLAGYQCFADEWIEAHGPPRILLLGVTPEIYALRWPKGHDFVAVDQTRTMIDYVWPGRRDQIVEADWLGLPLPSASRDLAFCDGGLHLLEYPSAQLLLVDRLHDVIAPGGRCIFRLFTAPTPRENADKVLNDLLAGRIPNLNVLKLRLGMALQESPEAGIKVRETWRVLWEQAGDWDQLAAKLGWPIEHLQSIDAYKDSESRYYFISEDQAIELFCGQGRFVAAGSNRSGYLLGERCPIVVFERL